MADDEGGFAMDTPLGLYRPPSVTDPASTELDGLAYVALNDLPTSTGPRRVEIRLATGQWILADPATDLVPGLYLDAEPERLYIAQRYGEPWNGWDTPVIDCFTLQTMLNELEEPHRWAGSAVWVGEDEKPFEPGGDGLYDTHFLGWTFVRVSAQSADPTPASHPR